MNSSIAFFINLEDKSDNRRHIRKNAVSVFKLADAMFVKQFRVNKPAFRYLLSILESNLRAAVRSTRVSPEIKLATFLRFLGEGGYQTGTGNDYNVGLAQSTVSVVLSENK